jgi:hypothetical protein
MDAVNLLAALQEHVEEGALRHNGIYSNKELAHMIWNVRTELERLRGGFDLVAHLHRQRAFSERTFGPGARTAGVIDHIRKELTEIEAAPNDLSEWIDVVLLALDGAWRAGFTPEQIAAGIAAKQARNETRTWPDWRTAPADKAIEHNCL